MRCQRCAGILPTFVIYKYDAIRWSCYISVHVNVNFPLFHLNTPHSHPAFSFFFVRCWFSDIHITHITSNHTSVFTPVQAINIKHRLIRLNGANLNFYLLLSMPWCSWVATAHAALCVFAHLYSYCNFVCPLHTSRLTLTHSLYLYEINWHIHRLRYDVCTLAFQLKSSTANMYTHSLTHSLGGASLHSNQYIE